jgi:alanyl-tRNA synthetase
LDDVGRDTYHHTMFEMLGTGLLAIISKRSHLGLGIIDGSLRNSEENLYVTIFEGDEKENLERDTEAYDF